MFLKYPPTHTHTHTPTPTHTHTHTHTHPHTHTHTHTHTHIYTHTHTPTHSHADRHTHTHTPTSKHTRCTSDLAARPLAMGPFTCHKRQWTVIRASGGGLGSYSCREYSCHVPAAGQMLPDWRGTPELQPQNNLTSRNGILNGHAYSHIKLYYKS